MSGPAKRMKSIRVHILEHEVPLRVREQDEAFTAEVAAYVDGRLREARHAAPGQGDLVHAFLGALSIAEDLFLAREALERLRARVGDDAADLADRLDAVLQTGGDGAADGNPPSGDASSTNPNEP